MSLFRAGQDQVGSVDHCPFLLSKPFFNQALAKMILRQNAPLRAPQVLSVAMVSVSFLLLGCGGSDPPPLGSLNPNSTTYPGVVSTSSGTGGTGSSEPCVRTPPPSEFITDFSDWVGNDWGSAGKLAGGSFDYNGDATTEFAYQVDLREENMHITGVINDYAGFGISLDPCTDATRRLWQHRRNSAGATFRKK